MERIIGYFRTGHAPSERNGYREEPLSTFLYDLPHLTICNVIPPLHILNAILLKGGAVGSHSPDFAWEPFKISEQEYQEILPKLLDPDWAILRKKLWLFRLPMRHDPEFHNIADQVTWMMAVLGKYGAKSSEEVGKAIEEFERENPDVMKRWRQAYNSPSC
ncbi:hypothetical protein ACQ4M3_11510 [Leptolyngbya sp. AN03gr2]|uniref:hypothetical protein n=1 Tax=unclassified Leptolyngbya TaxID=2650499 RepID=UPI003D32236D